MLKISKKLFESKKKEKSIFDIVLYGSAVKGGEEVRDVDILIIFLEGTLKERLDILQKIKIDLEKELKDMNLDLKQILMKELFSPYFLARAGIFLEGVSLLNGRKFCETLGFRSHALFFYSLKGLTHSKKVQFNYLLAGRTVKGILKELNGKRIISGAVKIPMENSGTFEEILKKNGVSYARKNVLEQN